MLLPPPPTESCRLVEITEKTQEIHRPQLGSSATPATDTATDDDEPKVAPPNGLCFLIIIIYTTYIAPYIWPVWPFIGAEEGPSKY